jgi:hypothetical protein
MNAKMESTLDIGAALLVLFSALLDPVISVIFAVIFLLLMLTYKINHAS